MMKTGINSGAALVLAAMLAAAGCSHAVAKKTESVEGARIERQSVVDKIKPGETTRQMLLDAFGPPTRIDSSDGTEKIIYEFREENIPVYFGVVENETARSKTEATLEVVFKGDTVSSFRYRSTEN